MSTSPDGPRKRGRPRDPGHDRRILAAAREVVAERGMCSASVTAIADRAGVGKPTLYLRWRSLEELVSAAFDDVDWTAEAGARFRAAVAAIDALADLPEGRFLVEVAALSAQERLGWLPDRRPPIARPPAPEDDEPA
jgi:AcrR family transcriptional regulator